MIEPKRRKELSGAPAKGVRVLIVESDYYQDIADTMRAGAVRALQAAGCSFDVMTVPGALEIPQAIVLALAEKRGRAAYDGVVALGCVIRGETSHYNIVARESGRALMDIAIERVIAVGNGILTVNNIEQAKVRAALDKGDKGGVAAAAVLALVKLKRGLKASRSRP
jgi:6,7-dimethyl-8-ribityllumazine synthase